MAAETKAHILQVTRTLYSMHGFNGTTLDDILTASGVTKGAFYYHFKSKELLCEAVLEQVIDDYQQLGKLVDEDIAPIEQLRQMVNRIIRLNASGQWVNCRLMLCFSTESHEAYPRIESKIREFWQWSEDFYTNLIEKCRSAGQLGLKPDARIQRRLLMSLLAGAILLQNVIGPDQDAEALCDAIVASLQLPA